jgi:hypothetical protein
MNGMSQLFAGLRGASRFIAMPPNPALNRTGWYAASTWRASARPAG